MTNLPYQYPAHPELAPEGHVVSAVDWRGNRFRIGDTVMYCIGAGRGQMMALGTVVQIRSEEKTRREGRRAEPGETPTRILDWHDPPVPWVDFDVPYDDVTVQVLTETTSGRWNNETRSKPAWVNPMNITAMPQ